MDVIDLCGRHVTTLHDGPLTVGDHALVWEGTDERGRGVASGVYFARVLGMGREETVKLALVK